MYYEVWEWVGYVDWCLIKNADEIYLTGNHYYVLRAQLCLFLIHVKGS